MAAYQTVVVGTDGSESSYLAVDRAAAVAADSSATLVIACAYQPREDRDLGRVQDELGSDVAYQVVGFNPAEETVRTASERARKAGATNIETVVVDGDPVPTLAKVVHDHKADLLVVGNRGLNTLAGRILGSVPAEAARKSSVDVLIVHTTG
ncbi:Universal stress protein UspA [Actinokineospora spheciospongiae]|uniref:Universal stress protein UspA n=1 Tax=Actinokineospora spheciospongiae TaxID=909613 RepID=W7IVJ5_9PSEU|nr:universal stress protein [Actinokineospora spheciospongiae]EWC60441.1 Universal stress protein UspA [Actinokineospora spheciospongiae]PWW55492.1 nucleotide-binding universal stress UspA family protein [Actinokineospora spheciospongiae]